MPKARGLTINNIFMKNTIKNVEAHNRREEEKVCWKIAQKKHLQKKNKIAQNYDSERIFWAQQKKKMKSVMSARTTVPLRQGELNGAAEADSDDGRKRKKKKKKKKNRKKK